MLVDLLLIPSCSCLQSPPAHSRCSVNLPSPFFVASRQAFTRYSTSTTCFLLVYAELPSGFPRSPGVHVPPNPKASLEPICYLEKPPPRLSLPLAVCGIKFLGKPPTVLATEAHEAAAASHLGHSLLCFNFFPSPKAWEGSPQ